MHRCRLFFAWPVAVWLNPDARQTKKPRRGGPWKARLLSLVNYVSVSEGLHRRRRVAWRVDDCNIAERLCCRRHLAGRIGDVTVSKWLDYCWRSPWCVRDIAIAKGLYGSGRSSRSIDDCAIAKRLHLSPKTVETHRAHIKEKLDLENARQVARLAVQWVGQ